MKVLSSAMMILVSPLRVFLLFLVLAVRSRITAGKNMNDGLYTVANSASSFSTEYTAEYFEVYSPPIKTQYGQVFWAGMEAVPLPNNIVERFTNKTMAIVGYEVDQVVRKGGRGGGGGRNDYDKEDDDVPVPITHAYNHHYIAALFDNRKGQMVKQKIPPELEHSVMTHGTDEMWEFEYHKPRGCHNTVNTSPSVYIGHSQIFSEANGGEMRLSYHGYPEGYAQLIQSPNRFSIDPMQIDTWNRDAGATTTKFVPGPLPKISRAPQDGDTAIYSGLLECPCSDRLEKKLWKHYQLLPAVVTSAQRHCRSSSVCQAQDRLNNSTECFAAGRYVLPSPHQTFTKVMPKYNASWPEGCSLNVRSTGVVEIVWNEKEYVNEETEKKEPATETNQQPKQQQVVAFAAGTLNATVTLTSSTTAASDGKLSTVAATTDTATITLVGPADKWFGIGFGTNTMCRDKMHGDECPSTGPYAIVVAGDHVEERLLDYHGTGHVLTPDGNTPDSFLSVLSNTVEGDFRTVQLQRPLDGLDGSYFSFDIKASSLDVIMATGCSLTLAQHCDHGTAKLNFLATDTPRTVCGDGELASIGGRIFHEGKRCAPFPTSTLVEQQNPTCSVRTYQGGLHCCHHLLSLLDKDQEDPWPDQPLEYHLKFRFYFEEYTPEARVEGSLSDAVVPASHDNLMRFYWMTEANAGEYDIVQCPPETPTSQCVQVITSRWSIRDFVSDCDGPWCTGKHSTQADGIELIYAGPHCHAPSCLSMELYNADTGALLCHVEPRPGQSTDKVYDEMGFLAIPPCLWSKNEDDGLAAPVFLPLNTTLMSIKRNNSTLPHFGEMASWQMRGVVVMNCTKTEKSSPSTKIEERDNEVEEEHERYE